MQVERPRGHAALVERLWEAARAGRLPHALSFEGQGGIGKFTAARWFALGLLCEQGPGEPCRSCGGCKRVLSGGERGNHPDLFLIDPVAEELETIRVGRVARRSDGGDEGDDCIEAFLALRAVEASIRPVLVREAHRMNAAAQNALLKTLEEPRPGTLLLLETHRPELLLPTIRSRCVRVRLEPLGLEDAVAVLAEHGVTGEEATRLARATSGSPGRALEGRRRGLDDVRAQLAGVIAGARGPLEAAAAIWELDGEFSGGTPTAQARDRARFVLDLALELVRDLVRRSVGMDAEAIAHADALPAGELDEARLLRATEALLACRADVDRNLVPEAVVERGFLALRDAATLGAAAAATSRRAR